MNDLQLEVLQVLDKSNGPMIAKNIFQKCELAPDSLAVANALAWLFREKLVDREKTKGVGPGGFVMAYSITDDGRAAIKGAPETRDRVGAPACGRGGDVAPDHKATRLSESASPAASSPWFVVDRNGLISVGREGTRVDLAPADALALLRFLRAVEGLFVNKQTQTREEQ